MPILNISMFILAGKMKSLTLFIFFLVSHAALSQIRNPDNYISWNGTRTLTINDFTIKTSQAQTLLSFAQFTLDCEVNGFDFMTRNFNKKVHNYFIKSASWIDTTYNMSLSLQYQQTLFNIAEIYARRFRKELRNNRRKILRGTEFVKELNVKILTDFSARRIIYDTETEFGQDSEKQRQWENQIDKELLELDDFAAG